MPTFGVAVLFLLTDCPFPGLLLFWLGRSKSGSSELLLSVSFGISVIRERSLQRLQCSDISPVDVLVAGMSMVKLVAQSCPSGFKYVSLMSISCLPSASQKTLQHSLQV